MGSDGNDEFGNTSGLTVGTITGANMGAGNDSLVKELTRALILIWARAMTELVFK